MSDEGWEEGQVELNIGPLYPMRDNAKYPMYSYDRPTDYFWTGACEKLREEGWSNKEIVDWLQSKSTRWLLDGRGDELVALGKVMAEGAEKVDE